MALERDWFPIKGEPKVKQITEGGEEIDWRYERSQSEDRAAMAPPRECPVNTTGFRFFMISNICKVNTFVILLQLCRNP